MNADPTQKRNPRLPLLLGGCLILAALASAQQPDPAAIAAGIGQQSGQLAREWLHSSDGRTRAWGAYLALRDRRRELVPDLIAFLENYLPGPAISQAARDEHDAIMAALDALIQLQAAVPLPDVAKIYPEFPLQALLLLPQSEPAYDRTNFLMNLFQIEEHNPGVWQASGNMLARPQAWAFGALVLKSLTVRALVVVVDSAGQRYGRGIAGDCFGPETPLLKSGWPEVGRYDFAPSARGSD